MSPSGKGADNKKKDEGKGDPKDGKNDTDHESDNSSNSEDSSSDSESDTGKDKKSVKKNKKSKDKKKKKSKNKVKDKDKKSQNDESKTNKDKENNNGNNNDDKNDDKKDDSPVKGVNDDKNSESNKDEIKAEDDASDKNKVKKTKGSKVTDSNDPDKPTDPIGSDGRDQITAGDLIDILSKLRLESVSHNLDDVDVDAGSLDWFARNDEIVLQVVEKIDCAYSIWKDEPNQRYYFIQKTDRSEKSFSNLDEMIEFFMSEFDRMWDKSKNILREPKRTMLLEHNIFEPETLGFPIDEIMDPTCGDDQMRIHIAGLCRPPVAPQGKIFMVNTMEEPEVSECRLKLIAHSRTETQENVDTIENINNIRLENERMDTESLPTLQSWQMRYPLTSRVNQGPFDELELASHLRSQYVAHLSTPETVFKCIDPAELLKASGQSTTRTSFLTSFISTDYNASMASEISLFMLSLMNPSDVLVTFDFSDIPNKSSEYIGYLSLMAKSIIMYDENGVYTNITKKSLMQLDRNISIWASDSSVIERIPGMEDEFNLNNYRFRGRNNNAGDIDTLRRIGTYNGISGFNTDVQPNNNDRLAGLYPDCLVRRNYAINCDNWVEFNEEMNKDQWPIYRAIIEFLMKFRNSTYSGITSTVLSQILNMFIRFNEYMSTHWYTKFRMKQSVANHRSPRQYEVKSINYTMKGKTLAYILKSFTSDLLRPKMEFIDVLRFEASFMKSLIILKVKAQYIERILRKIHQSRSYSKKSILQYCTSECPPLRTILRIGMTLRNENNVYEMMVRNVQDPFERVLEPLTKLSTEVLFRRGIIPSVLLHQTINRYLPIDLKNRILNREYADNFEENDGAETMSYRDIAQLTANKSLLSTIYQTSIYAQRKNLCILLPYKYNHAISSISNDVPIKMNRDSSVDNLRVRLQLSPVPVSLIPLDKRDFRYEDDYVGVSTSKEACFIPTNLREHLIVEIRDAIMRNKYISVDPVISKLKFEFCSSFSK